MKFKRLTALAAALMCAAAMTANASAANIVFKGNAGTENAGKMITVALYDSAADIADIKAADIRYIEQSVIDSDGIFRIAMPVALTDAVEGTLVSNMQGKIFSDEIPLYCSALGTENGNGTQADPYSFQKALEMVEDGGKVIVDGAIVIPADFEWPVSDKTITVSGINDASIDIKTIVNFDINCNTTFENLVFDCEAVADGNDYTAKNGINANGYHVIIQDTVDTSAVLALRGGSLTKDVDSTNLEVYGGSYRTIYGGCSAKNVNGDCRLVVGGNVNANYKGALKEGFPRAAIHGGSWGGIVKGDCILTIKDNASAAYVYGGTNGQKTSHVEGKIQVNVEGGNYMNVFSAAYITEGKPINSEINMTGGTVEALFASDYPLTGDVKINVMGGTVTRRVFGGCYNDWFFSNTWYTDYYVNGSTTVTIGPDATLITDGQPSNGIFGGSRHSTNHTDEISKLIFTGGTYESLKDKIGRSDVCRSNHDYIVTATNGGSVVSKDASSVTITPDAGYRTKVNGTDFAGGDYTLTKTMTSVVFVNTEIPEGISSVEYTSGETTSTVKVGYNVYTEFKPAMIVSVYDSTGKLAAISIKPVDPANMSDDIEVSCNLESGEKYSVQAMLWSSADTMVPVCPAMSVTIPAAE